jgi:hypothetical protein
LSMLRRAPIPSPIQSSPAKKQINDENRNSAVMAAREGNECRNEIDCGADHQYGDNKQPVY